MSRGPGSAALFSAMVMLAFSAATVGAQVELAAIQGSVKDEGGRPIEGVTFRLRDIERGREVIVKSDKGGRFYRRGLPAIEYELVVEKEGYQPIHDKVRLNAGVDKRFDFKLVKAAPEGAAEFTKGVAAFNRGDMQAAVSAFEETLKKAPELPEVRVNLALAYLRLKRTEDAVAQLEQAAALAPDQAAILFQLGEAYIDLKALDKAAAALEKGLAMKSDLADRPAFDATVTLGAVRFAQGDHNKAAAAFERAMTTRPDATAPKLGLGKVHLSTGDVNRALQLFQQIVASAPGSPDAIEAEALLKELKKKGPDVGGAITQGDRHAHT